MIASQMRRLWKDPLFPILVVFLIFQGLYHTAGVNPVARLVTMASMVEHQSFEIRPYVMPLEWTIDWSRTEDGRYFSNKAPGPMLLAYPVYALWDKAFVRGETSEVRDLERLRQAPLSLWVLSFLFQILPFTIAAWALAKAVGALTQSPEAAAWALSAMLLGTSATFYLSSYFGHGVAAAALLWTVWALIARRFALAGFVFSLAFLSDYSGIFLAVPFGLALGFVACAGAAPQKRSKLFVAFGQAFLGALPAAGLWIWYHTVCFGGPFELPFMHQNPGFQDVADRAGNLWGVAFPIPQARALFEMGVGGGKGMLKNQPWVLFVLGWSLFWAKRFWRARPDLRPLASLGGLGTWALLYMNASFNSWDGGSGPGLRYISPILPVFALTVGAFWNEIPGRVRRWIVGLMIPTLAYTAWYWAWRTSSPLWHMAKHTWGEAPFRAFQMTLNFAVLGMGALWFRKNFRASARASVRAETNAS